MGIPTITGFSTFKLPLVSTPQSFEISLAGINYILTIKWNDALEAGWEFDLADAITNLPIVAGIPLVTGVDCLAGLEYLGINGRFIVYTDGDDTAVPTLENLGVESNVYFLTEATDA